MTTNTLTIPRQARHAALPDLVDMLRQQADVRYDVVVPGGRLRSHGGLVHVQGGAARITDTGVEAADAVLAPNDVYDDGLSDRLGIPRKYLRRMRDDAVGLLDANVNHWLGDAPGKQWLVRGFRTDDADQVGIARAFLSDHYRMLDNYDFLLGALDGVRAAGVDVQIDGADLSDRRMVVRIVAPQVQALAPDLLGHYRRPWGPGQAPWETQQGRDHGWIPPTEQPIVFAGLVLSNSEVGGGAWTIVPRVMVQVCRNGLVITKDAMREVHLGGRLEAGVVRWSDTTQQKALDLVRAKTADAVRTFLDVDYVRRVIADLEADAATPVPDPVPTVQRVAKAMSYTEGETNGILGHFLAAGQLTAGGVLGAVTSWAQEVGDPDRAYELEAGAFDAMTATLRAVRA